MDSKPSPPPGPQLNAREETARPFTRQELKSFRNPFFVFGKRFKVDDLVFRVISYTQLPREGSVFKLWYENAEDPVRVSEEELESMLSGTDCLYYPENRQHNRALFEVLKCVSYASLSCFVCHPNISCTVFIGDNHGTRGKASRVPPPSLTRSTADRHYYPPSRDHGEHPVWKIPDPITSTTCFKLGI
ncbi:hypothetical protein HYDPIDRAFT_43641 [Hydnomerulius pinastri MD-312]|uniref:Uncharacterized protein n=1 Tax=Hydnomerulius pinastri MD-312 TaxID=994086 RepID=A0A0C9W1W6_9AGAM|nr:hypothetical protein HYDPIDRAFT_43641 [Hydnomerulius pinastri MD-312]